MATCLSGLLTQGMPGGHLLAQEAVITERTPSRSEYFSWINNTNEGAAEAQTLANLDFFEWMHGHYGMTLDIYAFDAGLIDGKGFYGSTGSERFKSKFPQGLGAVFAKATRSGTRLGVWMGPDGFGDTEREARERTEMLEGLCRDYRWALFKFDAVCGPLRSEKEDCFVEMIRRCKLHSPDLISLNHRLGLEKASRSVTTFLWEGRESYTDVNSCNTVTAPHNRAGGMSRGLVPGMRRLTEDHGVCLSSCLDYWDDELVLQAFGRSLLLAPQIYGNPWLLSDREFPKLARIFNLHRKYARLLVDGMELPPGYGADAVSRGDGRTRLVVLKNLAWEPRRVSVRLDGEIGLEEGAGSVHCRLFHPVERVLGSFRYGQSVEVVVPPFRSLLMLASYDAEAAGPGVTGCDYEVVRDVPGAPLEIRLLALPGTAARIGSAGLPAARRIEIDGRDVTAAMRRGRRAGVRFGGTPLQAPFHRKLAELEKAPVPADADALYEATVFAADNNAMEVRSLLRSGATAVPQVKAAREAFLTQPSFVERGLWDRYLFDGDSLTGFWPSRLKGGSRIAGGCFRLDLGADLHVDSIRIWTGTVGGLMPLLQDEGHTAYVSSDLRQWRPVRFLAGKTMVLPVGRRMRYLKMNPFPDAVYEVAVYGGGRQLPAGGFRASNLFADRRKCAAAWTASFRLDEIAEGSRLCVAVNGRHGVEGAYAALKVDGKYVGAPSRAVSFPANPWENVTGRSDSNYTYFIPLDSSMAGRTIEVFVMGYDGAQADLRPEVWLTAAPVPYKEKRMMVYRE